MNKKMALLLGTLIFIPLGAFWLLDSPLQLEEENLKDKESDAGIVQMSMEKAKLHGILTEKCNSGYITTTILSRGKIVLDPDRHAHILPKVSGMAKDAKKNMGDTVEEDEIIAVLESREVAETKASYLAALGQEKLASLLFSREARLYDKKISAEQEFLNSKFSFEEAKINLNLAKQKLFALGFSGNEVSQLINQNDADFRLYEIRSPIKGTVINRHITFGEYIEETVPIYEIADLSQVWVEIGIYPKDFEKVKEGQGVIIDHSNDKLSIQGKIAYLCPVIEEDTITAKAVVVLDNTKGEWKPGSFIKAKIIADKVEVPMVVCREAVQMIDGEPVVFTQVSEGFRKNPVQLGQSDHKNIEILAGLEPGMDYVTTSAFLLKADLGKGSMEPED